MPSDVDLALAASPSKYVAESRDAAPCEGGSTSVSAGATHRLLTYRLMPASTLDHVHDRSQHEEKRAR